MKLIETKKMLKLTLQVCWYMSYLAAYTRGTKCLVCISQIIGKSHIVYMSYCLLMSHASNNGIMVKLIVSVH